VADLDLRVALGRERREPAGPPAETAREVHVCGGVAGGDEEQWRRGGSRRRTRDDGSREEDEAIYICRGYLVPGEAMARD